MSNGKSNKVEYDLQQWKMKTYKIEGARPDAQKTHHSSLIVKARQWHYHRHNSKGVRRNKKQNPSLFLAQHMEQNTTPPPPPQKRTKNTLVCVKKVENNTTPRANHNLMSSCDCKQHKMKHNTAPPPLHKQKKLIRTNSDSNVFYPH